MSESTFHTHKKSEEKLIFMKRCHELLVSIPRKSTQIETLTLLI
jgi:hypothetical protein